MAGVDVVVVPSRWPDPCPLTVLEGMAAGAAVIASDIGGIAEVSGGASVLVSPDVVDSLAEALAAMADDESGLRRLQRAARERAKSRDWRVVAHDLDAILNRRA
jgi:glycosyltransferase involved in cell wall biosynthesis